MDIVDVALVLRFRDLVTDVGQTIEEHQKVILRAGHAWWGWWRRQQEHTPRNALASLFDKDQIRRVPIYLFDVGSLELYLTSARIVVVAPTEVAVHTPELLTTPLYYSSARYPVWFRLDEGPEACVVREVEVIGRPTVSLAEDQLALDKRPDRITLESLRDEKPTLWLARKPSASG